MDANQMDSQDSLLGLGEDQMISHRSLARLSALAPEKVTEFQRAWPTIERGRRLGIARALVEMAEDNVEFNFDDLFRVMLDDVDGEVRMIAVEGLWEDQRRTTAEILLRVAQNDADERVRATAASALGRWMLALELGEIDASWGGGIANSLLAMAADRTQAAAVRRRAVETAGYLSTPDVRALIADAYADDDSKLRASSLFAMGRNCDARWYDTLLAELANPNPEFRFEAARALGELEDRRAAPALIKATRDEDEEVRLAAIASLGKVGGPAARQALQRLKVEGDPSLRPLAEEALDELLTSEDPLGVRPGEIGSN